MNKKKNPVSKKAAIQMAHQTYTRIQERLNVAFEQLLEINEELLPFYRDMLRDTEAGVDIPESASEALEAVGEAIETLEDVVPTPPGHCGYSMIKEVKR